MRLTKQILSSLICESFERFKMEDVGLGDWIERIGALDDYPEIDKEMWNNLGDLLADDDMERYEQGKDLLDTLGFEDWNWLSNILESYKSALYAGTQSMGYNLKPSDMMYSSTYEVGDELANPVGASEYLGNLKAELKGTIKKFKLRTSDNFRYQYKSGAAGAMSGLAGFNDPAFFISLGKPTVGLSVVAFGGASGQPIMFPYAEASASTSREFADWYVDNFGKEVRLSGDAKKDVRMIQKKLASISKYKALNSELKQSLFLKKPDIGSKLLGAKSALGLEE